MGEFIEWAHFIVTLLACKAYKTYTCPCRDVALVGGINLNRNIVGFKWHEHFQMYVYVYMCENVQESANEGYVYLTQPTQLDVR